MADRGIDTRILKDNQALFFPAYDGLRVIAQSGDVLYGSTVGTQDGTIDQGDSEDFEQGVWLKAILDSGGVAVTLDYVTLDDRIDAGGGGGGGGPVAAEDVSVEGLEGLADQQAYDEAIASVVTTANEGITTLGQDLGALEVRVANLENA